MPRADPRLSGYCAVRHLLRHISNVPELLRNPLTTKLIGSCRDSEAAARAMRGVVANALASMDDDPQGLNHRRRSRHSAIIMRCDVLHEPREKIAVDLGLSIRQFERERREAMRRFARTLLSSPPPKRVEVTSSLARLALDRADRLADGGDQVSARVVLDDVARQSADNVDRILALICKANLETSEHNPTLAQASLQDARFILHADDEGDRTEALARACEAADLRASLIANGAGSALGGARKASAHAFDRHTLSLLVARAEVLLGYGDIRTCQRVIEEARSIANHLPDADAGTLIDISVLEPQVRYWSSGNFSARELKELGQAEGDAMKSGYSGRAAFIRLLRLAYSWRTSRARKDRQAFRAEFVKCTRRSIWPKNLLFHMFHLSADIEGAAGDPWRAAEAARRALDVAPNNSDAVYMKSLLSESYARGGRRSMARTTAIEILHQEKRAPWGALLNAARVLAATSFADGHEREGRRYIAESRDLARQFAPPGLLIKL